MENELIELEAALRSLRPRAPSEFMVARVRGALSESTATPVATKAEVLSRWPMWVAAAGFAAAVSCLVAWQTPAAKAPVPYAAGAVTRVERTVVAEADDAPVTLSDGTMVRRSSSRYVDATTWRDPAANVSVTWLVPREEVRVVPVNTY